MVWIVLAVLVAIAAFLYWTFNWDVADGVFFGCLAAAVSAPTVVALIDVVGEAAYDPVALPVERVEVIAAKDGSQSSGNFSIFFGYVDEEPRYFYYYEKNGGFVQGNVSVEDTTIYEDQESDSYLTIQKYKSELLAWGTRPVEDTRYEFHVPKGSVQRTVEFDLE